LFKHQGEQAAENSKPGKIIKKKLLVSYREIITLVVLYIDAHNFICYIYNGLSFLSITFLLHVL